MTRRRATSITRRIPISEAKATFANFISQYKQISPNRTAYMGDGRGLAASNLIVPEDNQLIYARRSLESTQYFVVKNTAVSPEFNKPIILGYMEHDPSVEQVIAVNDAEFRAIEGGSTVGGTVQKHGDKHQFGGTDTVFIDPRQFLPGLVTPTSPPSMQVIILEFVHFYNRWGKYPGETSIDLSAYLPVTKESRYVLMSLDPSISLIIYTPGDEFDAGFGGNVGLFDNIPEVPGDSIPLAAIKLSQNTSVIDWNRFGTNNIIDVRLHIMPALKAILDRLTALEESQAAATGNQAEQVPPLM